MSRVRIFISSKNRQQQTECTETESPISATIDTCHTNSLRSSSLSTHSVRKRSEKKCLFYPGISYMELLQQIETSSNLQKDSETTHKDCKQGVKSLQNTINNVECSINQLKAEVNEHFRKSKLCEKKKISSLDLSQTQASVNYSPPPIIDLTQPSTSDAIPIEIIDVDEPDGSEVLAPGLNRSTVTSVGKTDLDAILKEIFEVEKTEGSEDLTPVLNRMIKTSLEKSNFDIYNTAQEYTSQSADLPTIKKILSEFPRLSFKIFITLNMDNSTIENKLYLFDCSQDSNLQNTKEEQNHEQPSGNCSPITTVDLTQSSDEGEHLKSPINFEEVSTGTDEGEHLKSPINFEEVSTGTDEGEHLKSPINFEEVSTGTDEGEHLKSPINFEEVSTGTDEGEHLKSPINFEEVSTGTGIRPMCKKELGTHFQHNNSIRKRKFVMETTVVEQEICNTLRKDLSLTNVRRSPRLSQKAPVSYDLIKRRKKKNSYNNLIKNSKFETTINIETLVEDIDNRNDSIQAQSMSYGDYNDLLSHSLDDLEEPNSTAMIEDRPSTSSEFKNKRIVTIVNKMEEISHEYSRYQPISNIPGSEDEDIMQIQRYFCSNNLEQSFETDE